MLGTQLLLEEREQNGDDDSGLYRFTKDNEEDGDGEHIRHGDGEDLNRVSEGRVWSGEAAVPMQPLELPLRGLKNGPNWIDVGYLIRI